MKNYALTIFLGSSLVLVVKIFNDIRNEINPFESIYSLVWLWQTKNVPFGH